MKILGIIWTACSTATVLVDGRVVACISENSHNPILMLRTSR